MPLLIGGFGSVEFYNEHDEHSKKLNLLKSPIFIYLL